MHMDSILSYLEQAIQLYAVDIVLALVILVLGRLAVRWITGLLKRVLTKRGTDATLSTFVANLAKGILLAVVVIAALGQLGIETTSLVAIVGAAGLAIGLALQGSLSNFAAGVMLIVFRPFKSGDFVEAGGVMGVVEEVQIFTTSLRSPDNKHIIVPNAKIIGDSIVNYSTKDIRRIDLVFGIGYQDDIRKAKDVLHDIIGAEGRVLADPAPTVGVLELGDSSVNFAVRPWVKTADYWDVYFALTEEVKLRFDAEGISIPFPQRDVHVFQEK
jgi:small conductance mechanosensitive channel